MTLRPVSDAERAGLRTALAQRDQGALDGWGVRFATGGVDLDDAERVMREELAAQPEDVRHWWEGPCNCHGLLN